MNTTNSKPAPHKRVLKKNPIGIKGVFHSEYSTISKVLLGQFFKNFLSNADSRSIPRTKLV